MILFLSKSDSMTNVPRQFFKLPQQFRDNPEPNQIGRDQIWGYIFWGLARAV